MILELKQWPESQEVINNDDWFFITAGDSDNDPIGYSAYARVLNEGYDEGYYQYKKAYEDSVVDLIIGIEALELLSRHPVTSIDYTYVASLALTRMRNSTCIINRHKSSEQNQKKKKGDIKMAKMGRPKGTTKDKGYKVSTGRPKGSKSKNKKKTSDASRYYHLSKNWGKWIN